MNKVIVQISFYMFCLGVIFYGWVENIVKLYNDAVVHVTGQTILRAIGVFVAPIGVVMGYL